MRFLANENFPSRNTKILRDQSFDVKAIAEDSPDVIYFRCQPLTPKEPAQHLLKLINAAVLSFEGHFTALERERIRQRLLP
jgi:hypothetical protein